MALGTGVPGRTTNAPGRFMPGRVDTGAVQQLPVVAVEFSPTTNPGSTPSWVSITGYVRSISIRRGRSYELDRMEAGTAQLTLDNRNRFFDPAYVAGPYYGNLLPMRRLRIWCTWKGVTYYLFHGFVESWPQTWPGGKDAVVSIRCVDGFKSLSLLKLNTSYSAEATGTRIANVLNSVGWPAADRDIDTGSSTVQAATLANASALDHLQQVIESESGRMYISATGALVFLDRASKYKGPYNTPIAVYSDETIRTYQDIAITLDDTQIWNEARVTRSGGTEQTTSDATSIAKFYTRTLVKSSLVPTDSEALSASQYLVSRYKDPQMRIERMDVTGMGHEPMWAEVLGRELGDRVTVIRTPEGVANNGATNLWVWDAPATRWDYAYWQDANAAFQSDEILESITHNISPDGWRTVWQFSPAEAVEDAWIWDDPRTFWDQAEWIY